MTKLQIKIPQQIIKGLKKGKNLTTLYLVNIPKFLDEKQFWKLKSRFYIYSHSPRRAASTLSVIGRGFANHLDNNDFTKVESTDENNKILQSLQLSWSLLRLDLTVWYDEVPCKQQQDFPLLLHNLQKPK